MANTSTATHRVVVYHDETKDVAGGKLKGHVLFFVPKELVRRIEAPLFGDQFQTISPFTELCAKLQEIRGRYHLQKKMHFTDVRGKRWGRFDLGMREVVDTAVDALRHRRATLFPNPLCMKVAVMFYAKDGANSIYTGDKRERRLRHDETMLRMLLKGALHYLYGEQESVEVQNIIADGLPEHRSLSDERILKQLLVDEFSGRTPLRDNVTFAPGAGILHISSDHKDHAPGSLDHGHANMLQIADLLLGGVIHSCMTGMPATATPPAFDSPVDSKKDMVAFPVMDMLNKAARGKGFVYSGHHRAFTVSEATFSDKVISFKSLTPQELHPHSKDLELLFPDEDSVETATQKKR